MPAVRIDPALDPAAKPETARFGNRSILQRERGGGGRGREREREAGREGERERERERERVYTVPRSG